MNRRHRLAALLLALCLLLTPTAQALTTEQAKILISENYIDPVSDAVLAQPTIEAMLAALGDPYSNYFTPKEYLLFQNSMLDATQIGIGISYQLTEAGVVIGQVFPGSAAHAGGLAPGDILTDKDTTSLIGISSEQLQELLAGVEGSTLTLTYLRDNAQHSITLTRQAYTIPVVSHRLVDGHIGYIACTAFGDDTMAHFEEGIATYGDAASVWVVDLTSNGGGTVYSAIQTVNAFSGPGPAAYLRDSAGNVESYGLDDDALTDAPVIVLTNRYTASASELFASAIRDNGTGAVVGERTFGKGVAQSVYDQSSAPDYFPDGSALKLTTARFYAPGGTTVDTVGVIPHFSVDEWIAPDVALLLASAPPIGDNSRYLLVEMGSGFYINLDTALTEALRPAFIALLEAIPANARLLAGTGSDWKTVSVADVVVLHQLAEYKSRGFSDSATTRYGQYLDVLATYGILQGIGDGSYHPSGILTRGQLCALLAQALGCKPYTGEGWFSDVGAEEWYYSAVNSIAQMGLIDGVGDGTFRPNEPVDHQQLIAIMARLGQRLNLGLLQIAETMPQAAVSMPQLAAYDDWARPGLWLLAFGLEGYLGNHINMLWAEPTAIVPTAASTREEAAVLLYSVLAYTGVLPS